MSPHLEPVTVQCENCTLRGEWLVVASNEAERVSLIGNQATAEIKLTMTSKKFGNQRLEPLDIDARSQSGEPDFRVYQIVISIGG